MQWIQRSNEWRFEGRPINLRKPKAGCKTFQIFVLKNFLDIYFAVTSQPLYKAEFQGFISRKLVPNKVKQSGVLSNLPGKVFSKPLWPKIAKNCANIWRSTLTSKCVLPTQHQFQNVLYRLNINFKGCYLFRKKQGKVWDHPVHTFFSISGS